MGDYFVNWLLVGLVCVVPHLAAVALQAAWRRTAMFRGYTFCEWSGNSGRIAIPPDKPKRKK